MLKHLREAIESIDQDVFDIRCAERDFVPFHEVKRLVLMMEEAFKSKSVAYQELQSDLEEYKNRDEVDFLEREMASLSNERNELQNLVQTLTRSKKNLEEELRLVKEYSAQNQLSSPGFPLAKIPRRSNNSDSNQGGTPSRTP